MLHDDELLFEVLRHESNSVSIETKKKDSTFRFCRSAVFVFLPYDVLTFLLVRIFCLASPQLRLFVRPAKNDIREGETPEESLQRRIEEGKIGKGKTLRRWKDTEQKVRMISS